MEVFWSDIKAVPRYVRNKSQKMKIFLRNRVQMFKENPADYSAK